MSDRRNDVRISWSWPLLGALVALCGAGDAVAATKVVRAAETPEPPASAVAQAAPARPSTSTANPKKPATTTAKPAAKAPATTVAPARPAARSGAAAASPAGAKKSLALPTRRPIVLDALHVEGKTEAPRVLFVHAGPTVALEDAPAHPSYLRDDFTAALSSPVRVRVRDGAPVRPTTAGGNR